MVMEKLKKLVLLAAIVYAVYWLLIHHLIFFGGRDFEILLKKEPVFNNTFVSIQDEKDIRYKGLENILTEDLREAGLAQLLLDRELITEKQLKKAEDIIDYGE